MAAALCIIAYVNCHSVANIPKTVPFIHNIASVIPILAFVIPNTPSVIPIIASVVPNTTSIILILAAVISNTPSAIPIIASVILIIARVNCHSHLPAHSPKLAAHR